MQILRTTKDLQTYLESNSDSLGCLADTGFLYAVSYDDDRVHTKALETFEQLAEFELPIFANVVSRMEFIDLIFRKQLTLGAIEVFKAMNQSSVNKSLFNLLKSIRDQNVAHTRTLTSYKISEAKLKTLREEMVTAAGPEGWKQFCDTYSGKMLINEWQILEEELGLNFVEVLEGKTSDIISKPLFWNDMVTLMGRKGLRGPDAMIANLFFKSQLSLLITTDSDLINALEEEETDSYEKAVLHLS